MKWLPLLLVAAVLLGGATAYGTAFEPDVRDSVSEIELVVPKRTTPIAEKQSRRAALTQATPTTNDQPDEPKAVRSSPQTTPADEQSAEPTANSSSVQATPTTNDPSAEPTAKSSSTQATPTTNDRLGKSTAKGPARRPVGAAPAPPPRPLPAGDDGPDDDWGGSDGDDDGDDGDDDGGDP